MNLTDADKVWFEQQKVALVEDKSVRLVALAARPTFLVMRDALTDYFAARRAG